MANRLLHKVLSWHNYSYLDRLYCNSQAAYIPEQPTAYTPVPMQGFPA